MSPPHLLVIPIRVKIDLAFQFKDSKSIAASDGFLQRGILDFGTLS